MMRHLPIEQCELFLGEQRKVTLVSFVLGWNKASLGDVAIERRDLEETA